MIAMQYHRIDPARRGIMSPHPPGAGSVTNCRAVSTTRRCVTGRRMAGSAGLGRAVSVFRIPESNRKAEQYRKQYTFIANKKNMERKIKILTELKFLIALEFIRILRFFERFVTQRSKNWQYVHSLPYKICESFSVCWLFFHAVAAWPLRMELHYDRDKYLQKYRLLFIPIKGFIPNCFNFTFYAKCYAQNLFQNE